MASDAGSAPAGRNPLAVILTRRFARQVLTGRWFTVYASLLIMASSGATYIFGSYSGLLKSSLGYDQRTLNTVSFFKDLGASLGVLSGLLNEVTPPWAVLSVGAAMNLGGYLMAYLAVTGRTPAPPVWLVCAYFFAGANSQAFASTGALVTCVANFPETRGAVLGILQGFVGLSGAIYTQLYLAFYGGEDPAALLLLVACVPAAVSVLFLGTVRYLPRPRRRRGGGGHEASTDPFFCFLYLSVALACFLLVMIVLQQRVALSRQAHALAATPLFILLLLMPLGVVTKQEYRIRREREALIARDEPAVVVVDEATKTTAHSPPPPPPKPQQQQQQQEQPEPCTGGRRLWSCPKAALTPPARGEDYTILQALVSVDMLVLFVATTCGAGGTLTAIDNLGQIGQALGYPARSVTALASLVSVWNYAGRVAAGYASDALLARFRVPRPLLLTLVLLLACAGHLLLALGAPGALHAASVLAGFCFGALWPLVFAVTSELFGLRRYSTLYNFGGMASPVGTYVFSVRVAGRLYDAAARRQGAAAGVCVGVECYREAFLIITAATVFGAAVSLVLVWRTWAFYRGDIYARFREDGDGRLPVGQQRLVPVPEHSTSTKEESSLDAVNGSGSKG